MMTLMRVPDMIDAVEPLIGWRPDPTEMFRLIGQGEIKPLGVVWRAPIFAPSQIGEVAAVLQRVHGHQGGNHE